MTPIGIKFFNSIIDGVYACIYYSEPVKIHDGFKIPPLLIDYWTVDRNGEYGICVPADKSRSVVLLNAEEQENPAQAWYSCRVREDSLKTFYGCSWDSKAYQHCRDNLKAAFNLWVSYGEGEFYRYTVGKDEVAPVSSDLIIQAFRYENSKGGGRDIVFSDFTVGEARSVYDLQSSYPTLIDDISKCQLAKARIKLQNGRTNMFLLEEAKKTLDDYCNALQKIVSSFETKLPAKGVLNTEHFFAIEDEELNKAQRTAAAAGWIHPSMICIKTKHGYNSLNLFKLLKLNSGTSATNEVDILKGVII